MWSICFDYGFMLSQSREKEAWKEENVQWKIWKFMIMWFSWRKINDSKIMIRFSFRDAECVEGLQHEIVKCNFYEMCS